MLGWKHKILWKTQYVVDITTTISNNKTQADGRKSSGLDVNEKAARPVFPGFPMRRA